MLKTSIAKAKTDIKARVDTYSDGKFSMTVGNKKFTEKKEAGVALATEIVSKAKEGEFITAGKFAGFELKVIKQKSEYIGTVAGAQNYRFKVYPENTTYMVNHISDVVQSIEHKVDVWADLLAETKTDLAAQEEIIASPFAKQAELDQKTARFNEVMAILNPKEEQIVGEDDDTQYQARTHLSNEAAEFTRGIDEWNRSGKPEGEAFVLGSTGDVLQGLGAIESDVYMLSNKINAIFREHPEITIKEIKSLPEILENPVLVLASQNTWKAKKNTRLSRCCKRI